MPRRARAVAAVIIALLAAVPPAFAAQPPWGTHAVIYEIYPRSFQVLMASPAAVTPRPNGLHMAPFGVLVPAFGPANCTHPGVGARQKPRC